MRAVDDSVVWDCLRDCLRDGSAAGARVGRGWLLRLLQAAAEAALRERRDPAQPLPALLPEASPRGCRLEPGQRGLRGQARLQAALAEALLTGEGSHPAEAFISAVEGLLASVCLQCQGCPWEAEVGGGAAAPPATPAPAGGHRRSASAAASPAAAPLGGAASPAVAQYATVGGGGSPERAAGPGRPSVDGWQAVECGPVVVSTISLAVEWLLLVPAPAARQLPLLRAMQLLLSFLTGQGGGAAEAAEEATPQRRQGGGPQPPEPPSSASQGRTPLAATPRLTPGGSGRKPLPSPLGSATLPSPSRSVG